VKIKVNTPGETHIVERIAPTFEDAINTCVDTMREKLTRSKEKLQDK